MTVDIIVGVILLIALGISYVAVVNKIHYAKRDQEFHHQVLLGEMEKFARETQDFLDTIQNKIDQIDLPQMIQSREEESIEESKRKMKEALENRREEMRIMNGYNTDT